MPGWRLRWDSREVGWVRGDWEPSTRVSLSDSSLVKSSLKKLPCVEGRPEPLRREPLLEPDGAADSLAASLASGRAGLDWFSGRAAEAASSSPPGVDSCRRPSGLLSLLSDPVIRLTRVSPGAPPSATV